MMAAAMTPTSAPSSADIRATAAAWRDGGMASLPMSMAVMPFGMVCGATAAAAGLDFHQAFALSWMVFAGSSQLVAVHLLASGAPVWVILLTGWLVNLRFVMYSAALAPCFSDKPWTQRTLAAYFLVDQSFALTLAKMAERRPPAYCAAFYFALSLSLWVQWQAANLAGILLGTLIPGDLSMDFIVALTFISFTVPLLENRLARVAALTGCAVALAPPLPFRLNLMVAALAGAAVALALEHKWKQPTSGR